MRQISSPFYDEEKRFELLKAIAPSIISMNNIKNLDYILAQQIVVTTDLIIEELKKGNTRTKDSGY